MTVRNLVSLTDAIRTASYLVSDDGENPEYDRAIYELIVDLFGVGVDVDEGRSLVAAAIKLRRSGVVL